MKTKVSAVIARPCVLMLLLLLLAPTACVRSPEQKRARFLAAGKELYNKKDYVRAILQFRSATKVAPQDPESYYQLALAYIGASDFKPAIFSLRRALELNPKHIPAQVKMADLLASTRDKALLEEAEKGLHDVLAISPVNEDALNILGVTEWGLGKREDAVQHLTEALYRFPKNLIAALTLVQIKLMQNDFKGAEDLLKKFSAENPTLADPVLALGELYVLAGKPGDAEQQFRRASEIDPKNGLALLDLGGVQLRAGRSEEAERTYSRLSALPDRQYRPVHAIFLSQSGKPDLAIAEFEKLAKEDPKDRTARDRLLQAYYNANRKADVEKALAVALRENAKDVDALLQRSRLYLDSGKYSEAQDDLGRVFRFKPDSAEGHYLLARVCEKTGAALRQRQELGEAVRLAPGFLLARLDLARLLVQTGAPKSALEILNEAGAQKNSLPVIVQRNWANLMLKDMDEFRKGLDQASAMAKTSEVWLQEAQYKSIQLDHPGARKSLEEALRLSPEDVRTLDFLVGNYLAQKQPFAAAVARIREHAVQHPRSVPVQYFLGALLMASGDRTGARRAFGAVKTADPSFIQADERLAQLDLAEGKVDEARKRLSAPLSSKTPTVTEVSIRLQLAVIEEQAENYNAAMQHCRRILELDSTNLKALNDLALMLVDYSNQPDEALKFAERAKEIGPENSVVADTLGWVLYRKGLYPAALTHFEFAASRKDARALPKCHLALLYFKLGKQQQGQRALDAALKLDPGVAQSKVYREATAEAKKSGS